MTERAHRAGVVAILGPPNAGKSTLLNRLLSSELAIVTPKPQTTRSRILGILNLEGAQLLLYDTPGLHRGTCALSESMRRAVAEVLRDCDVALVLVDLGRGFRRAHAELLERVRAVGAEPILVGTKADRPAARAAAWPPPEAPGVAQVRVSAHRGDGLGELLDALLERLPESPAYYPGDELTDRPLRFLAAELIREAAFEELAQELPYSVAVEVREFREPGDDPVRIRADLLVERSSQKRIAVGRGGAVVKAIGIRARARIETLLSRRVHLELWVKVDAHWARRARRVKVLGYE